MRICDDLGVYKRIREDLARSERIWDDLRGFRTIWKVLGRCAILGRFRDWRNPLACTTLRETNIGADRHSDRRATGEVVLSRNTPSRPFAQNTPSRLSAQDLGLGFKSIWY